MDLYAYANIDYLDELAKKNGIKCPRLRGYRLMKDERPVDTNIKRFIKEHNIDYYSVEHLCTSVPFWCPTSNESIFSYDTDLKVDYYLDKKNEVVRWDRIHGWKRRVLKTYIHNRSMRYKRQYEMWNKYVGRDDILYIHARIGGGNWSYYWKDVVNQPWFIEKVDDSFDRSYCDIYARIKA